MQERKRGTDVQNRLLDSVGEGEGGMFREDSIETCILSRVKQITSPSWMHETSAQGWYTGKTQRDRVEREVGGGIRMGNTCKSMADSCQCMTKPLQYYKVISLQLIKINGEKKLNIQKTNNMASGPITSCQIDGETMETLVAFIFCGSKITVDGNCSHNIKSSLEGKTT